MHSSGVNTLTERQHDLRSFITKQRSSKVTEEEKESDIEYEEMGGYEIPQTLTVPRLLDNGNSTDLLKSMTIGVTMKENHDEGERSQSQKSLVGRDILCELQSHDTDVNIGQLLENDEASSPILGRKVYARITEECNAASLPILYLDSIEQSLWLDFGDERSNMVGSSRSLQFQSHAPDSLYELSLCPLHPLSFMLIVTS